MDEEFGEQIITYLDANRSESVRQISKNLDINKKNVNHSTISKFLKKKCELRPRIKRRVCKMSKKNIHDRYKWS